MNRYQFLTVGVASALSPIFVALGFTTLCEAALAAPPNVVFIVADDLGYGDLGCYGQQKIRTPRIDRLAAEGLRLTQHYSGSPVCAPSRCVLMTGKHPGHAAIRNNTEVKPEGQRPLPADAVTAPARFKQAGYVSGGFGKWGLGPPASAGAPTAQGIDRWFGYNCQRVAHNHYPTYLWDNDRRFPLENPDFAAHQPLPAGVDADDPASFAPYRGQVYAMDAITDAAVEFVHQNKARPFFLYYPTVIPHLALQAPEDALQEYAGQFPESPYRGQKGYLPHRTPRAAYAAMISRLDRHVGQLIDAVEALGLGEQTLFVFTSDNGAADPGTGGADTAFFQSVGPLRGWKGSLYEGGFRVPGIVRWTGTVAAGTTSNRVSGFEDWLPTLLELCGRPDLVPADTDGISLAPTLLGKPQPERPFLYREFPGYGGQQSVRVGPWKAVRQKLTPPRGEAPNEHVELYYLDDDVAESRDVSDSRPAVLAQLQGILRREHTPSALFPMPILDAVQP